MKRLIKALRIWIGEVIRLTIFGFLLFIAYYIYSAFFAENPKNYFNSEDLGEALSISFLGAIFLSVLSSKGKNKPEKSKNNPKDEASAPEPKPRGSSKVAKAAFGLGAAALAKSGPPSKQPNAYVVSGDIQVTSVQHRGGKKWRLHYRALQPSGVTISDYHDFGPATDSLVTQGGQIKIDWS